MDSGGWQGVRYGNETRAHQEERMLDCYRIVRKGQRGKAGETGNDEQGTMNIGTATRTQPNPTFLHGFPVRLSA